MNDYVHNEKASCGYENLGNRYIIDDNLVIDTSSGKFIDATALGNGVNLTKKELRTDNLSETRDMLKQDTGAGFEIAFKDRELAHSHWLADKCKPSPVPTDMI